MMIPPFEEFVKRYDDKKIDAIGHDMNHIILLHDDDPESIKKYAQALYASAISLSFVRSLQILEEYHTWLKEQLELPSDENGKSGQKD